MHAVIRAIVYADNEAEALELGKEVINNLCGEKDDFDYATFFDEAGTGVSGVLRYGNIPAVSKAKSKAGNKLITEGMKYTKGNFMESIETVRDLIKKYNDEDLFEGKLTNDKSKVVEKLSDGKSNSDLFMFRYHCHCLGDHKGSEILLYDSYGDGIRNQTDLDAALNEEDNKDKECWVVPADVHF